MLIHERFSTAYETLVRLILPEGLLEYFELIAVRPCESGQLNIYLEEKNLAPAGYDKQQLESKGFLPETAFQDFPIRGHKVALCIKRRRWELKSTGAVITRDCNLYLRSWQQCSVTYHKCFLKKRLMLLTALFTCAG
ncbi:ISAon1 family transposase N-terminal region protein [Mucilaginibacter sabulilitoris]